SEKAFEHNPKLAYGKRAARQHHVLGEVPTRHVLVLVPIDGKVASPARLFTGGSTIWRHRTGTNRSSSFDFRIGHSSSSEPNTPAVTSWPMVGTYMAAVTSTISSGTSDGTIMFTFVRMV